MEHKPFLHVTLIGFGEAGGILGEGLASAGVSVATYDILLESEPSRSAMLAKVRNANVRACANLGEAIAGADLIISVVTASAAAGVARQAALSLRRGQIYLDMNSVSPETKRETARLVEPSGATFVEAAVMAPVAPQRLRVPMLLGGTEANSVAERLQLLGMDATPVSVRIGVASAIKLCRSVIIKGLEALAVEALFAARWHGAEKEVLASLAATYPQMGWNDRLPDYLISRVAQHGHRRASEMREAAETLRSIGLEPLTALATAARQEWLVQEMAERRLAYEVGEPFSWKALADAIGKSSSIESEALTD
jgi:3-hydroxyisobutyrate dehydrogenase-like beta-hydroxyacid dehydrogenase